MEDQEEVQTPFWDQKKLNILAAVGATALVALVVKNTLDLYNLNKTLDTSLNTINLILEMIPGQE